MLPSLLDEFADKVDLIYIDPPFATGQNFSFQIEVGEEEFLKEANIIETKAYNDTWGRSLDSYSQWIYETLQHLFVLLGPSGSIFVHCDWRLNSIIRLILDEIFAKSNFRNEITWRRAYSHNDGNKFGIITDTILWYSKSDSYNYRKILVPRTEKETETEYPYIDEKTKRRYKSVSMNAAGQGQARDFGEKGLLSPPKGTHWRWSQERIDKAIAEGIIYFSSNGVPRYKQFADEIAGKQVQNLWTDFMAISSQSKELLDYPTQKPEALLERIVSASSNEGDLVLDCFSGSGTTAAVAEKLGRRWIACDLGRFAIHTARKRLLSIPDVKPFVVQNLGKYERQTWQSTEFGSKKRAETLQKEYRNFILELYTARPVEGYVWLHGIKGGRMVHVGSVDSPVALGDITQIAIEFKKAIGTGKDAPKMAAVDVLGWDFAFEINELGIQQAKDAGINLRCLKIPREVMDPKAVEQGDVKFFELAALAVNTKIKKTELFLELTDFTIPPDDVPDDVQGAIKHWSQWIDYWAVDWDNKADTFHNQWQTYRTRQMPKLKVKASHVYEEPGTYAVMVKVIDILGNDTTKVLKVSI